MKRILIGVCGISFGHINRQKPILDFLLSNGHDVSIFTFGTGISYFKSNYPEVRVYSIEVPYIHANNKGVDLFKSSIDPININSKYLSYNFKIMNEYLNSIDNNLDLVISDYEPISAQLSYITSVPLITIDQQSKYLVHKFKVGDYTYREESSRLNYFFPSANKRIACSFFNLDSLDDVLIVPSIIKPEIKNIKNSSLSNDIIVYESSFFNSKYSVDEVIDLYNKFPDFNFNIFTPRCNEFDEKMNKNTNNNIKIFSYSNDEFYTILARSKAAIANGGHSFISELMYLKKPVFCLPFPIFEQVNNANIIHENQFGISSESITETDLSSFINSIDDFSQNIEKDKNILNKECGLNIILNEVNKYINL